jgi:hypothetical protein
MYRPRGGDDVGLVGRRDVCTNVVESQCADGSIVHLEYNFEDEHQPVPGREFPTGGTGQEARTLWHLLASSGKEKTGDTRKKSRTVTAFMGHRILFVDV